MKIELYKMKNKEIYTYYRSKIGTQKSKKYLETMKGNFPYLELHHICGSNSGMKMTDYLVMPLSKEEHILAHKNMPKSFMTHFDYSVKMLLDYAQFEIGLTINRLPHNTETGLYCIESVCELIKQIYEVEHGKQ